eukprot:TRINITY_DN41683_c0_g1_i1.p1 TRINITY_DN41683_c0_g1~~TRINITY_DN41683_c0_g1_i1.p1  ORF type:complete len:593 (-),score=84.39 TRINITY_DN41683_c0_g1_i1:8-1786(-)
MPSDRAERRSFGGHSIRPMAIGIVGCWLISSLYWLFIFRAGSADLRFPTHVKIAVSAGSGQPPEELLQRIADLERQLAEQRTGPTPPLASAATPDDVASLRREVPALHQQIADLTRRLTDLEGNTAKQDRPSSTTDQAPPKNNADADLVADVAPPVAAKAAPHIPLGSAGGTGKDIRHGAAKPRGIGKAKPLDSRQFAYISIISNEKYVDGALVLAWTLQKHSQLVLRRECDLHLLVPEGLSDDSTARLHAAGWTKVLPIKDLSPLVPRSKMKNTFNKLYMFGLTQYKKIAFLDADVLCLGNPDRLFHYKLPNESYVGAIGRPGDLYFKTGMMVVQPSARVFEDVMAALRSGDYNHAGGRDGKLLRNVFHGRFVSVNPIYSQYLRPWVRLQGTVVFHFRGEFKPWYNPNALQTVKPEFIEYGPGFRLWWEAYHEMHFALWGYAKHIAAGWGGAKRGPGVTAKTHVWLLRHTPEEYVQKIWELKDSEIKSKPLLPGGHRTCDTLCVVAHEDCDKKRHKDPQQKEDPCNTVCNRNHCHTLCEPEKSEAGSKVRCKSVCDYKKRMLLVCDDSPKASDPIKPVEQLPPVAPEDDEG